MKDPVWKIVAAYVLTLIFLCYSSTVLGQVTVTQFNADWNSANKVNWLGKLSNVDKVKYIDIAENSKAQDKYKIVVVPTIIIFKDGQEVKRFQADISFSMKATREEVQGIIDEQVMSDF